MKKTIFYLTLLIASFIVVPAQGQSFLEKMAKKAAKKAEEMAEKKAKEKAEKEIDKQLDKAFEEVEKSMSGNENADEMNEDDPSYYGENLSKWADKMAGLGYSSEPVPIEDVYSFSSSITMHMKTFNKEGTLKTDGIIKIYANEGDRTYAYEFVSGEVQDKDDMQKGIIIMDAKNNASIILNDEEEKKTGVVYGGKGFMDESLYEEDDEAIDDMDDVNYVDPRVTKTGRTKSILGYKCEEYKYKDEEGEADAWITKEMDWDSEDFMTTMFRSSMYSNGIWGGFLMASEGVQYANGEKSIFEIVDINKGSKSTFSLSQYEITNIGSFQVPQGSDNE